MVFTATSKNSFRHVSWSVWKAIRNLFPAAIELKRKRPGVGLDSDDNDDDTDDDFGCTICHTDKVAVNSLVTNLTSVAEAFQRKDDYHILTDSALVESACRSPGLAFRILHEDDVNAWNNFLSIFKKRSYKKLLSEKPEETAKQALLPLNVPPSRKFAEEVGIDTEGLDSSRVDFVEKNFRPIVCTNHRRPIHSALFQPSAGDGKIPHSLSARVRCMDENSYKDFIAHMAAAALMLVPGSNEENNSTHQYIASATSFCEQVKIDQFCHPRFFADCKATPQSGEAERFYVSTLDCSMPFRLEIPTCKDMYCCKFFDDWQATESCLQIALQPDGATSGSSSKQKINSSARVAGDPVAIDSDVEIVESFSSKFSLRVFDVAPGASADTILSDLASCSGLPTVRESEGYAAPRRSTRKRKASFPFGAIKDEDAIQVNLHHNLAALRLQIFERCCGKDSPFELDHSLKLVLMARPDTDGPVVIDVESESRIESTQALSKIVDLSFEVCSETLQSICEVALGEKAGVSLFSPAVSIVVFRQAVVDASAVGIPKDATMEHLINLSNATSDDKGAGNGKNRKKARAERGFTGTFLSSGPSGNTASSETGSSGIHNDEDQKTSPSPSSCYRAEPDADDCTNCRASTTQNIVSESSSNGSGGASSQTADQPQGLCSVDVDMTDGSRNVKTELAKPDGAATTDFSTCSSDQAMHNEVGSNGQKKTGKTANGQRKIAKRIRVHAPIVKANKVDEEWFNNQKSSEDDDDSSDQPTFRNEKAPRHRIQAVKGSRVTSTAGGEMSLEQILADRVAYLLRQNEDIPANTHDLCICAAEQAVLSNPSCKKAEDLVTPAYEMYLALTS